MTTRKTQDRDRSPGKGSRARDIFSEAQSDLEAIRTSDRVKTDEASSRDLARMKRKVSKLEKLTEVTTVLNSTLDLDEVLEKIIDSTIRLADTDRGFLMLANDRGLLEFRIARDRENQPLPADDFTVSMTIVNAVARDAEPLFISDMDDYERFRDQKSVIDLRLQRAVCVPLSLAGSVIGVIYTDSNRASAAFAADDMSVIAAFASQAAIAIENAKLHGRLVTARENLTEENRKLRDELSGRYRFSGIVGRSKPMTDIFATIQKVAPLATTVLIQGETGTGKELIAKAIHFNGSRKGKPLVSINCGAMPADLLESELFGHKKGAFTGAVSDKMGLFETANEGTIFLDEIGELTLALQVKLLRALQEGQIRRVGDTADRTVDVRVIAATNRNLADDVEKGRFRSDLYYRLKVVPITIPPLRERRDDILPLVEHFLEKIGAKMNKPGVTISPDAMRLLLTSAWPGNVRELENAIERALALCGESRELRPSHFPETGAVGGSLEAGGVSLKAKLRAVERRIIVDALEQTGWHVTRAAELLEVTRQHLHNKIKQHRITAP